MTAIQKACYLLIASAFVLGTLLVLSLQDRFTAKAQANLVLSQQNLTVLTAFTEPQVESLFVLDNHTQKLLVYYCDPAKNRMVLIGGKDLAADFSMGAGGPDRPRHTNR